MGAKRLRLGSLFVVTSLALSTVVLAGGPAHAAVPACAANGCWTAPFSPFGKYDAQPPQTVEDSIEFPAAASSVVMPDGRIMYWNGLQDLESVGTFPLPSDVGRIDPHSETSILDLTGDAPAFYPDATPPVGDDLFCADQRLSQNGNIVVTGGTVWKTEVENPLAEAAGGSPEGLADLYGSRQTHLYDTANNRGAYSASQWTLGNNMAKGRWYPTQVTLADGKAFVAGGVGKLLWNSALLEQVDNDKGGDLDEATNPAPENVLETETYDPDTNTWVTNDAAANKDLPLFARMHLLPNGEIFFGGVGQMWGPAGESIGQLGWNNNAFLDSRNLGGGWRDGGMAQFGARSGAFSAMLPLKAPYDKVDVLVGGGVLGTSPGAEVALNLSEIVHLTPGEGGKYAATAERTGDMQNARWYSSAVTLPNGHVVVVNGADKDEVVAPGTEGAIRMAELWDGSKWVNLSAGSRDRTYHNSAILLPDGSVLVGGHAPINTLYGGSGNTQATPFTSNNFKDPSFERLFPPYLYAEGGLRPMLNAAQKHVGWGETLKFVEDPANPLPIAKVVLSRLPSATHITDADARTVELGPITIGTGQNRFVDIPANRDLLPPGFYYLFALSEKGTPSEAIVVQISDPEHQIGGGDAAPIHLADQPVLGASASSIREVSAPKAAAGTTARSANSLASATTTDATPVSSTAPSTDRMPAALLAGFAAMMGIVLQRRVRLAARARA